MPVRLVDCATYASLSDGVLSQSCGRSSVSAASRRPRVNPAWSDDIIARGLLRRPAGRGGRELRRRDPVDRVLVLGSLPQLRARLACLRRLGSPSSVRSTAAPDWARCGGAGELRPPAPPTGSGSTSASTSRGRGREPRARSGSSTPRPATRRRPAGLPDGMAREHRAGARRPSRHRTVRQVRAPAPRDQPVGRSSRRPADGCRWPARRRSTRSARGVAPVTRCGGISTTAVTPPYGEERSVTRTPCRAASSATTNRPSRALLAGSKSGGSQQALVGLVDRLRRHAQAAVLDLDREAVRHQLPADLHPGVRRRVRRGVLDQLGEQVDDVGDGPADQRRLRQRSGSPTRA